MKFTADPELVTRRLNTQIRLLEQAAREQDAEPGELSPLEMVEWAQQIRNVANSVHARDRKRLIPTDNTDLI